MPTHVINAHIIKLNIKNRKKREQIFITIPSCLQNKRYLRCDFPLLFFPIIHWNSGICGTYIEKKIYKYYYHFYDLRLFITILSFTFQSGHFNVNLIKFNFLLSLPFFFVLITNYQLLFAINNTLLVWQLISFRFIHTYPKRNLNDH